MMGGFNDALFVFIPKGTEDGDEDGIVRSPCGTRPLGLKNCDVKAISSASHMILKRGLSERASKLQNGFVSGRNFLDNIVDIDSRARIFSMASAEAIPIMFFTDSGAASLSLIQRWLQIVMRHSKNACRSC